MRVDSHSLCIVVGSGPSGVSVARALLDRGKHVLMIDAGNEMDREHQESLNRMYSMEAKNWLAEDLARLCGSSFPKSLGIPLKMAHGSDFCYAETTSFPKLTSF